MLRALLSLNWKRRKPGEGFPGDLEIQAGRPGYEAVGREFVGYLERFCGLRPEARVLDIGCGYGRMAMPLTERISDSGEYQGFDVHREAILHCQRAIEEAHPHFQFRHLPVINARYNPKGKIPPERLVFPYEDGGFDIVMLCSVFTHLVPSTQRHYLGEVARLLRPGGRCLATAFLLDAESLAAVEERRADKPFQRSEAGYWTTDLNVPETAIAVEEGVFLDWCRACGLNVVDGGVHHGSWSGRRPHLSYQDVVILEKG